MHCLDDSLTPTINTEWQTSLKNRKNKKGQTKREWCDGQSESNPLAISTHVVCLAFGSMGREDSEDWMACIEPLLGRLTRLETIDVNTKPILSSFCYCRNRIHWMHRKLISIYINQVKSSVYSLWYILYILSDDSWVAIDCQNVYSNGSPLHWVYSRFTRLQYLFH